MTTLDKIVLPTNVRPINYTLKLRPDLTQFTFAGEETIEIEVLESTSAIQLNSIEINIQTVKLTQNGQTSAASNISYDTENETATLRFDSAIPTGISFLEIIFTGDLNDKLRGFYRSQYEDDNGDTHYLATTQFEATDARRAFPCWDEPDHKAVFDVTLIVPETMVALSNTPIKEQDKDDQGVKIVRFEPTPIMSTYLLAFIVGDLTHIEQKSVNNTTVSVWTTAGKEEQGRFALETSAKLLSFFNDYFGIPYPLPKLDHIAIPDFAAGAMENWGCITYRETALLVDQSNSSAGTRQRVAEVVAHEMAHMWFGDLVTMEWWDDLWLNESFASWMGTKAVDWAFPEWQMWTQFVNMDTNRALSLDGLKNSHPIEQEVKNPAEVSQLFDAISYSKGASVIRMLEQFLTPETFRQGLQQYISENQYQNARTVDLWSALENESNQPVTSIMETWTGQMGYPVLQVDRLQDNQNQRIRLSQRRFVYDQSADDEIDRTLWKVPVGISHSASSQETTLVLNDNQTDVPLPTPSDTDSWFKVNPSQTGFFRVNYSEEDWDKFIPVIQSKTLEATDRLGIQNDAYALSRSGLLPVSRFLALAEAYKNEDDASVWSDLASNLRDVETLIADQAYHNNYRKFALEIFTSKASLIGWDQKQGEGHLDALLRSTVLSQAGNYGDDVVLKEAQSRFDKYIEDPGSLHPDLRGLVYSLCAQNGSRKTYDQLWDLAKRTDLQEEYVRLLIGLTRFKSPELLQETLDRSLTDDVRLQDTITVVTAVAANLNGRDLAWNFLKDQWQEFDNRYGGGGFGLMRLVSICGTFSTIDKLQDVKSFFEQHPTPAAERTIQQSLERINLNIRWLERNNTELTSMFNS